jgi:hypothetical protein
MVSQGEDVRCFASNAERPGNGSPRTAMFGVNSAPHAASRSAKTSFGAARNIAIVRPSSSSSALHFRNPRIPDPHQFFTPQYQHSHEFGLDCVKTGAG